MLSRVARLAAIITIAMGAFTLASPTQAASEATLSDATLACGDDGYHVCCVDSILCGGEYCCAFNGGGEILKNPDGSDACGCQ